MISSFSLIKHLLLNFYICIRWIFTGIKTIKTKATNSSVQHVVSICMCTHAVCCLSKRWLQVWFSTGLHKLLYLLSIIPNCSKCFHFNPPSMTSCSQTGCWPLQKTPRAFPFYLMVLRGPQFHLPSLSPLIVFKLHLKYWLFCQLVILINTFPLLGPSYRTKEESK